MVFWITAVEVWLAAIAADGDSFLEKRSRREEQDVAPGAGDSAAAGLRERRLAGDIVRAAQQVRIMISAGELKLHRGRRGCA